MKFCQLLYGLLLDKSFIYISHYSYKLMALNTLILKYENFQSNDENK